MAIYGVWRSYPAGSDRPSGWVRNKNSTRFETAIVGEAHNKIIELESANHIVPDTTGRRYEVREITEHKMMLTMGEDNARVLEERLGELVKIAAQASPSQITTDHGTFSTLHALAGTVREYLRDMTRIVVEKLQLYPTNQAMAAPFEHWEHVGEVVVRDVQVLNVKDREYKASWKKRGGIGAWMMLVRKWDRIEPFVQDAHGCDILKAIAADTRQEGLLDDIRDLRRYLVLVEAEAIRLGYAEHSRVPEARS